MIFTRNLKNVIVAATALAGYYHGNTAHGIKLNKVNKSKLFGKLNGLDMYGKLITRNKSCVKSEATTLYDKLSKMSVEEKENWATQQEGYAKYMERAAYLTRGDVSKVDNYYVKNLAPYINANGFAALRKVPVEGKKFGEKTGHYLFVDSISDFWGGKVKVLFNNEGYGENRIIDENRQAFFSEDEIATVPTLRSFHQHRKSNIVSNCSNIVTKGKYRQQLHEMKFTELLALIAPKNEKEFQFGDMAKFVDGNTLGTSEIGTSEIPFSKFNKLSRTVRVSCTQKIENYNKFEGKVLPFDATRLKDYSWDPMAVYDYEGVATYPVEGFVKALNLREI
jgi:hypothetical protein